MYVSRPAFIWILALGGNTIAFNKPVVLIMSFCVDRLSYRLCSWIDLFSERPWKSLSEKDQ